MATCALRLAGAAALLTATFARAPCVAWGGLGGLDSAGVGLLLADPAEPRVCLELRADVALEEPLRIPSGKAVELRGSSAARPLLSAAALRGRAITVERGASLELHALVLADAPGGMVEAGGNLTVQMCAFERNGQTQARQQPAAASQQQWSSAYAASTLGLSAVGAAARTGRKGFGMRAAAGAAAGVLLGANMVRGQQCDAAPVSESRPWRQRFLAMRALWCLSCALAALVDEAAAQACAE